MNSFAKYSMFLLTGPIYQNRSQRNQGDLRKFCDYTESISNWFQNEKGRTNGFQLYLIHVMKAPEKSMAVATGSLWLSGSSLQLEKQIRYCCAGGFFPGSPPLEKQASAKKYLHSEKCPVSFPCTSPFL